MPRDLEKIIVHCLRKDPERRFQHMDDLKVALLDLKEESDSGKLASGRAALPIVQRRTRLVVLAAALAGVVGMLAFAAWLWWFSKQNGTMPPLGPPVPITTYPGAEEDATLSPDGRQVAFSGNIEAKDNFDIYVKLIGAEPPLRLTRDPDPDMTPVWSPDGRWIAFIRKNKLLLVSPLGGAERLVAEGISRPCAWSPDGQSLIVETRASTSGQALSVISIATGEQRGLSQGGGCLAVAHDGHKLAFAREDRLYVAPVSTQLKLGKPRPIDWVKPSGFLGCAWTEDDRDLVCALRYATDPSALWRINPERLLPRRSWRSPKAHLPLRFPKPPTGWFSTDSKQIRISGEHPIRSVSAPPR